MREQMMLFRYVLLVAVLAFCNRTLPAPFLPLVLTEPWGFHQSSTVAGLVMAMYPLAAFISTPASSWLARRTRRSISLHSTALIVMSVATSLFSTCMLLRDRFGNGRALGFVLVLRMAQGVSASLYLSANTTLITRRFPDDLPYVVGITEVAVGIGSQLGRLVGGFLYDNGGFACPFLSVATCQFVVALGGFLFEDGARSDVQPDHGVTNPGTSRNKIQLSWSELFTFRTCVALIGVLMNFLQRGFYDTTLPKHFEDHVGPLSITLLSFVLSLRSVVYLVVSFFVARLMHSQSMSYEQIISIGAFCSFLGLSYMALQDLAEVTMASMVSQSSPPVAAIWAGQLISLMLTSTADATLFVPSLPLMQREVNHLGVEAVERTSSLFISFMTAGEGCGPIIGGWLVNHIGFRFSAGIFAVAFLPLFAVSLVACSRRGEKTNLGRVLLDCEEERSHDADGAFTWRRITSHDADGVFTWRRIPFVQEGKRSGHVHRPWSSVPSTSWRRPYEAERGRSGRAGSH